MTGTGEKSVRVYVAFEGGGANIASRDLPCLKIVAASTSDQQLRLFSSTDPADKNIALSDAVAASIALPFIFRPHYVENKRFVDGGIVSSLPVWPFDEERALDKDAHTIAFSIDSSAHDQINGELSSLVNTMLFGASALNTRAVSRLVGISLMTKLGTLEFDASAERLFSEISRVAQECRVTLGQRLQYGPHLFTNACIAVQEDVLGLLEVIKDVYGLEEVGRVRVAAVFKEHGFHNSIRLKHYVGFDNDNDEELLLPINSSIVGEAWRTGDEILFRAPFPCHLNLGDLPFRRHRKLLAKDIRWVAAVQSLTPTNGLQGRTNPCSSCRLMARPSSHTTMKSSNFC